jgi:hypothetical protein
VLTPTAVEYFLSSVWEILRPLMLYVHSNTALGCHVTILFRESREALNLYPLCLSRKTEWEEDDNSAKIEGQEGP